MWIVGGINELRLKEDRTKYGSEYVDKGANERREQETKNQRMRNSATVSVTHSVATLRHPCPNV